MKPIETVDLKKCYERAMVAVQADLEEQVTKQIKDQLMAVAQLRIKAANTVTESDKVLKQLEDKLSNINKIASGDWKALPDSAKQRDDAATETKGPTKMTNTQKHQQRVKAEKYMADMEASLQQHANMAKAWSDQCLGKVCLIGISGQGIERTVVKEVVSDVPPAIALKLGGEQGDDEGMYFDLRQLVLYKVFKDEVPLAVDFAPGKDETVEVPVK